MPRLDIFPIVHTSYDSLDPADSAPPAGPSYDPGLQQLINGLSGLNRPRRDAEPSAPVTASSADSIFFPFEKETPLGAAEVTAKPFAGANSPVPASDLDSPDPAPPAGPSYDPGLQQLINGLSGLNRPRREANPSAPVSASSADAVFFPFGKETPLGAAQVTAVAFAGADSPLAPSDVDSADPAPPADGGPSYDPELQQLINGLSGLGQPAPHSEPIQTSRNTSWHHVRIDP